MEIAFLIALLVLAAASFVLAPRVREAEAFFRGWSPSLAPPGLLTLIFSQVTTWIFARSLLTAAILGFYYGMAGALAYTAYYISFFTGRAIIDAIRFKHGCGSIQEFLVRAFGVSGTWSYNFVIGVRLISEVFANLLVIGVIFGVAGSGAYIAAILILSVVTLAYSMLGGLRASLRTDVFQMSVFLVLLVVITAMLMLAPQWSTFGVVTTAMPSFDAGWNLLIVALLQVWSYPMHDPVMMDRGFLVDRETTRRSFFHAGWLSMVCIFLFSLLGVFAGPLAEQGETLLVVLTRIFGEGPMMAINLALIVSAVSTLDSTLSSSAKLTIVDMKAAPETLANGRIAMALFMVAGLVFVFIGSKDLFDAVAVSGTASMFLTPVIVISIWMNRKVAPWAYQTTFAAAMAGAALYYIEAGKIVPIMEPLLGIGVKYNKLLLICIAILVIGFVSFAVAMKREPVTRGR